MFLRSLRTAAAAASLAVLLMGSASAQTLEIATDASPSGLDPHLATAFATILINGNIYEGLTAIDTDLRTVPALATEWTVTDEGKTYTFKLRPNVAFHNGKVMTSADVAASVRRVVNPQTGSPLASRFVVIDTVETPDAGTVVLRLKEPSAPLLSQLASLAVLPAEPGVDLGRQTVGTGPFRLTQWVPDTFLMLEKHAAYWEAGLPKLGALKFNIVPDATARQVGLAGGTYHLIPVVEPAIAQTLQGRPGVQVQNTQDLAYTLIGINTTKPPFDNPAVREAINTAVDRSQIVQAVLFGRGEPGGPLSPGLKDWAVPTSEFPCYRPDAAKARQLLQGAGVTLPLKVTMNVIGSLPLAVESSQVVQAQMNQAGFEVTLNVQEQGRFIQDWRASNFEVFASLNGGGVDPDDYLYRTFRTGGSTNVFKYSDPQLDALLDRARSTADMGQRQALYRQAQQALACRGPIAHLTYSTLFAAHRQNVEGFTVMPTRSTRSLRSASLR
jgi:peptide/nickel transport system substrate-binding protein